MKKVLIALFCALLFVGCASKSGTESGVIKTSNPIFLKSKPAKTTAFVNFTNTSEFLDSNLTEAVKLNLRAQGYHIVPEESLANLIIKGNLNYFRRTIYDDRYYYGRPRFSFGFGFGRGWGGRHHGGWGFGMGHDIYDYDDDRTSSYIYDGQLSLLIRIKNGKKFDDYSTNLNYQSGRNVKSKSTISREFNDKVIQQINLILNN